MISRGPGTTTLVVVVSVTTVGGGAQADTVSSASAGIQMRCRIGSSMGFGGRYPAVMTFVNRSSKVLHLLSQAAKVSTASRISVSKRWR